MALESNMSLHHELLTSSSKLREFLDGPGVSQLPEEEVNDMGQCSLLVHAGYAGCFEVIEMLMSYDANLRSKAKNGGNVVDCLCFRPDTTPELIDLLLQKWISNFGDEDCKSMLNSVRIHRTGTPLMSAVFAPNVAVSKVLLSYGAKASYATEDGSCALDLAAQTGGRDGHRLVSLLLDANADPNVGAIGPLFLAVQENDEISVRNLLSARAHVDGLKPGASMTPIECASRFGFLRVLKLLLSTDDAPRGPVMLTSALKLAQEQQHMDIERILIKAGAGAPDTTGKRSVTDVVEESFTWLPVGFRAGSASFQMPQLGVKTISEKGTICIEEVEECYRIRFQGSVSMTASSISPVRCCPEYDHYYYEVSVEEMDLLMAMGFARNDDTPQETLPGWTPGTYGVHSDDGLLQSNGSCVRVMPSWKVKQGSTVGMGISWCEAEGEYHLFVTLDGQRQVREVPLPEEKDDIFDLWPVIGADRAATLRVNLGASRPFVYQDQRTEEALRARKGKALEPAAKKPR